MIYLYTGTPGSGKSLDTARMIKGQLKMKHPVICNFPMNVKQLKNGNLFEYKTNEELTPAYLMEFSHKYFGKKRVKEGAITLVIDEAQMLFNARDWNKPGRADWNMFFQMHRHYGYDIVLSTQFDSMIDKQLRALVEYQIIHRKISNYGLKGYLLQLLFLSPALFIRIKVWYPMKEKIDSRFYRGNKKLYSLYDTYALSFLEDEDAPAPSDGDCHHETAPVEVAEESSPLLDNGNT